MDTCPEVDKRWNNPPYQIDLNWLEEHVKTCAICQHIMRLVNQVILPEILGEDENEKGRSN